ncbi:MAG: DUF3341 domain-containing protein [Proteobacteria bacterium]|nr:DUF3341 domain-containing protein [Pseudomonadota bacterium]
MAKNILGLFQYEDDFITAAKSLKASGFNGLTLMSPIRIEEADEIVGLGDKSRVRHFSLVGAICGAFAGFSLAVACALVFILPTGGRAIITIPPFLIITYEMTILFGVLATLLGFHFVSGLPAWRDKPYKIETNIDRFSILVELGPEADSSGAEKIILDAGAEEVTEIEESA